MNPDELTDVLEYLNQTFPQIQRITTYARSDTINRLPLERLKRYRNSSSTASTSAWRRGTTTSSK